MALVDDIADLLAIHNEVNTVCGQRQEWVVGMVQLKKGKAIFSNIFNFLKLFFGQEALNYYCNLQEIRN